MARVLVDLGCFEEEEVLWGPTVGIAEGVKSTIRVQFGSNGGPLTLRRGKGTFCAQAKERG